METNGEGNDLEERYINVHRGGKRQAPQPESPRAAPAGILLTTTMSFTTIRIMMTMTGAVTAAAMTTTMTRPPGKNPGTPGTVPGMPPPIKSTRSSATAPRWGGCAAGSIGWWWYCQP